MIKETRLENARKEKKRNNGKNGQEYRREMKPSKKQTNDTNRR